MWTEAIKRSKTVQIPLNDGYVGGKLCFFIDDKVYIPPRPPGSLTKHDPRVLHGVTSVQGGTRNSLFVVDKSNGLGEGGVLEIQQVVVELFRSRLETPDLRDEISKKRERVQDIEAENNKIIKSAKTSTEASASPRIIAVDTLQTNELDELKDKLKDSLSAAAVRRSNLITELKDRELEK